MTNRDIITYILIVLIAVYIGYVNMDYSDDYLSFAVFGIVTACVMYASKRVADRRDIKHPGVVLPNWIYFLWFLGIGLSVLVAGTIIVSIIVIATDSTIPLLLSPIVYAICFYVPYKYL